MSNKKKYANFSASFVDLAKEAGIDNTYIPEIWKIFFRSSPATHSVVSNLGRVHTGRSINFKKGYNRSATTSELIIVKGPAKKAAPKKASLNRAAPKKAAPKKGALKKAAPKKSIAKKVGK